MPLEWNILLIIISPLHWLSETIETMLSGRIRTSSLPATQIPVPIPDRDSPNEQETTLFLAPFLDELRVIASIWAPILPFHLSSTHLVPLSEIRTCQVEFPFLTFGRGHDTASSLCLKFTSSDQSAAKEGAPNLLDQVSCAGVSFISTMNFEARAEVLQKYIFLYSSKLTNTRFVGLEYCNFHTYTLGVVAFQSKTFCHVVVMH